MALPAVFAAAGAALRGGATRGTAAAVRGGRALARKGVGATRRAVGKPIQRFVSTTTRRTGRGGAKAAKEATRGGVGGTIRAAPRAAGGKGSTLGRKFRKLHDVADRLDPGGGDRRERSRGAPARRQGARAQAASAADEGEQGAPGAGGRAGAAGAATSLPGGAAGGAGGVRRALQAIRRTREVVRKVTRRVPGHKMRQRVVRVGLVLGSSMLLLTFCTTLATAEDERQAQQTQQAQFMVQMLTRCAQTQPGGAGATGDDGTPSVLGSSLLTAAQIQAWWRTKGTEPTNLHATIDQLITFYVDEGRATGVRGDVAFAQAIHETGWFNNTDSLVNNYAGLGNGDGSGGHAYNSPRQGVRAHLDLLKSYTAGDGPGQAQTWGHVGDDWSGTDTGAGYWGQVRPLWEEMLRHAGVTYRSTTDRPAGSGSGISQGSRSAADQRANPGGGGGSVSAGSRGSGSGISQGSRSSDSSLPAGMDLERTLAALRLKESGSYQGDYDLDHPRGDASGAYGFMPGTWGNYRGYAEAMDAPPAVQDERARQHIRELLRDLDGPSWQVEVALGWFLGAGDGRPYMNMPDSDPRWDQPPENNITTPRQYLQKFREHYEGASGGAGGRGAGTAGTGCPPALSGVGGAGTPTTAERQRIIQRAKSWLTAVNGGPVPYSMSAYHDSWRTDCSGFVSMAWELDYSYSTVTLPSVAEPISRERLQPGDVMNKPEPGPLGHVIIFEHWMDGSTDRFMAIEQSGGANGTVRREHSYSSLHRQGYRPLARASTA